MQGAAPSAAVNARASDVTGGEARESESAPVVKLDKPRQFAGAVVLKSERIVYCPIEKVRSEGAESYITYNDI